MKRLFVLLSVLMLGAFLVVNAEAQAMPRGNPADSDMASGGSGEDQGSSKSKSSAKDNKTSGKKSHTNRGSGSEDSGDARGSCN